MDPVLSTAYPVNKIGADGLSWWIGQVESYAEGDNRGAPSSKDPKKSGRYRVRIVGRHLKDCNATPSDQLPWANVMMPATAPWSDGGKTGASILYTVGSWVIGIYLDNDQQKPLIIGSIGHTAGATLLENIENDPNPGNTCKSFTTFLQPDINPFVHARIQPSDLREDARPEEPEEGDRGPVTDVGQAGVTPIAARPGYQPAAFLGLFQEASVSNPTGKKVCVEIANPNCGSEKNFESNMKKIIADLLKAVQQSNGNIGTYYVSKATGELNDYIGEGRKYINKAILLTKSLVARLKGEIVKAIRDGIDKLVELLLYKDAVDELGNTVTGPVNPDLGIEPFAPVGPKVSRLKEIMDTINDVLNEIGCSMEDLTDRIADFITDTLFGFLQDAYVGAACLVDTVVSGIINQIIAFIETTLTTILGPLLDLLGPVVSSVNLIGGIVAKAFDILGISCDGLPAQCEKIQEVCVDCSNGETDDNWLDNLLDQITDGPLDTTTYVCDEARRAPVETPTTITFIGGIPGEVARQPGQPNPGDPVPTVKLIQYTCEDISVTEGETATFTIERFGDVTKSTSINVRVVSKSAVENVDFQKEFAGSSVGFAPYQTRKTLSFTTFQDFDFTEGSEDFFIRIESRVLPEGYSVNFPNGRDFRCTINDGFNTVPFVPDVNNPDPYIPPSAVQVPPYVPPTPLPTSNPPITRFDVRAERDFYLEGQNITWIITGTNAVVGQSYNWEVDVDPEDIVGGETSGTFIVGENEQGFVTFTLSTDNDNFRVDPPGTVPLTDPVTGEFILDSEGNVQYNEEDIITEIDDLDEIITLTVVETSDNGFTTILGEDNGDPAYFVSADASLYNEGDTITYSITTYNVPDNTILTYTLAGDVTTETFTNNTLGGSFEIIDGQSEVQITVAENETLDPGRLVVFSIDGTSASVAVTIVEESTEESVLDDTPPLYSIESDKLEYTEGETIEYTITTSNVDDGTVLQYVLSGVDPSDIVGGNLNGRVVIIDGTAKVYISIEDDTEIESAETLTFLLSGTNAFTDVVILGDIVEEGDSDPDPIIERDPCLDKPVALEPLTDETGSIISIPLDSQGCPYLEPPRVIVGGEGTGATAIALLDDTGRVSEVRVTRVGNGYRVNTSKEKNLTCVIDSFTILNAGRGYTSPPAVLIDNKPGIAEAIIDERGLVVSVQIVDRSVEIEGLPRVTIQGGGGGGARALPSIVCLDSVDELAASGYAKIGTGKYVDCP